MKRMLNGLFDRSSISLMLVLFSMFIISEIRTGGQKVLVASGLFGTSKSIHESQ